VSNDTYDQYRESVAGRADVSDTPELLAYYRQLEQLKTGALWTVANKIEPVFVEQIEDMPQAILDVAQDNDVVITMGAGTIGQVPGQVVARQAEVRTSNVVDLNGGAA